MLAGTPALAAGFRAENHVTVRSVGDRFVISDGGGFGARGMWCAAAEFARENLSASGEQRLYIVGARTGLRAPVTFSLTPGELSPMPVVIVGLSLRQAGSNLTVDHAYGYCADAKGIDQ